MKKTLTINLNDTVFHIDQDAYERLKAYLDELSSYFGKEEGSSEILADIEARIAELFSERVRFGRLQVVTLREVDEVMAIMGTAREMDLGEKFEEEEKTPEQPQDKEHPDPSEKEPKAAADGQISKRFYRDPDNRILGGVLGGMACYLNMNATLLRILFLILCILFSPAAFVYLALWIIVPAARTAAQRLEMRGINPTVENIKDYVRSQGEKAKDYIVSHKSGISRFFDGAADFLRGIFNVIFATVGGCLGCLGIIVLIPLVILSLIGLVGWIVTPYPLASLDFPAGFWSWDMIPVFMFLPVWAIPLGALIYFILSRIFKWRPIGRVTGIVLFVVWIICVIGSFFLFASMLSEWIAPWLTYYNNI